MPSFVHYFPQIDTLNPPNGDASHTATIQAITVGAYTLGCFFGAVATIWLGNMLGRKKTIFIGAVTSVVGSALQAAAVAMSMLMVGRFIGGMAVGML